MSSVSKTYHLAKLQVYKNYIANCKKIYHIINRTVPNNLDGIRLEGLFKRAFKLVLEKFELTEDYEYRGNPLTWRKYKKRWGLGVDGVFLERKDYGYVPLVVFEAKNHDIDRRTSSYDFKKNWAGRFKDIPKHILKVFVCSEYNGKPKSSYEFWNLGFKVTLKNMESAFNVLLYKIECLLFRLGVLRKATNRKNNFIRNYVLYVFDSCVSGLSGLFNSCFFGDFVSFGGFDYG